MRPVSSPGISYGYGFSTRGEVEQAKAAVGELTEGDLADSSAQSLRRARTASHELLSPIIYLSSGV